MSIEIKSEEQFRKIKETSNLVLLDFYTTWCGPCKRISPFIELTARQFPSLTVCKIDVEQNENLSDLYDVGSFPTFIIIQDGIPKERIKGANKERLKNLIRKYLSNIER